MKTNPFARLFAVLGVAVLVGVLLCSRDHRLEHQGQVPAAAADTGGTEALAPSIESLSETPATPAAPSTKP